MSNQVTASITFSFKGKTHTPSIDLDLDEYMQKSGQLPNLYILLAKAGDYDLYSYEYEMMQAEPIIFSNAKGMVSNYIADGILDIEAFEDAFKQHIVITKLSKIAKQNMAIDDLKQHPNLLQSLLEAYRLGETKSS
ncbi:MAG: hypothetical protein OQK76_04265 [Gammaproteobacteria bacterium]|nr:hypothetical protein [Gammaproteobacteria bacterium]MCW9004970.1 hypothetical protein [Gammaproteobacteria bacterium]MCW9056221.1 hypothetical protein [Gammaproteobacteria bacterium]